MDYRKNRNAWFVAGIGLGALTGILLAPQSGRETRKAIAVGVDRGIQHAEALGHKARKSVTSIVESGKNVVARKREQVDAAVEAVKARLKRAA